MVECRCCDVVLPYHCTVAASCALHSLATRILIRWRHPTVVGLWCQVRDGRGSFVLPSGHEWHHVCWQCNSSSTPQGNASVLLRVRWLVSSTRLELSDGENQGMIFLTPCGVARTPPAQRLSSPTPKLPSTSRGVVGASSIHLPQHLQCYLTAPPIVRSCVAQDCKKVMPCGGLVPGKLVAPRPSPLQQ